MAALISSLAVSGSRKSDGTANASGKVFLYQPGTTTQAIGYRDEDLSQAWTTSSGGIPLDAAGKASIWVNDPVDVVVQDSSGTTVSTFLGFNWTRAEQVEVENDGYTGALTDSSGAVTQALGGKTDLDTLLTRAYTSIGPDFQYLESSGATKVNVQDFLRDVWISVRQFGADPTGIADSTSAIQQTIDRVKARGGGVVYFPPGVYKISSALSLSSANGVTFMGAGTATAGNAASQIRNSSTTANVFTISGCSDVSIAGLYILHSASSSSGSAMAFASCTGVTIDRCTAINHRFGIDFSAACNTTLINNCKVDTDGNAASRAVRYNLTGLTATRHRIICGEVGATTGSAIEYNGTTGGALVTGTRFSGGSASGVLFNASLTGTRFAVIGTTGLDSLTTAFDLSGLSTDPALRQFGNEVDGYTENVASGGTVTPNRAKGSDIRIRGTSTGAAFTINAPVPTPGTGMRDVDLYIRFFNNAGGAITGWTLNAAYHAAAVSTTDLEYTSYHLKWDADASVWRQYGRDVST